MDQVLDVGNFVLLERYELKFKIHSERISGNFCDQIVMKLNGFNIPEVLQVLDERANTLVAKTHHYDSIHTLLSKHEITRYSSRRSTSIAYLLVLG